MAKPGPAPNKAKWVRSASGRNIPLDGDGFLVQVDDWDEDIALALARADGVKELTDAQWTVIRFLREFYLNQGKIPLNHKLKAGTGLSMMELEEMFPGGIKNTALRWAGLPNLRGCS